MDHDKVEAAVAEAVTWDYLVSRSEAAELCDIPGVGGLDFGFRVRSHRVLVEVTNISIASASAHCGIGPASPHWGRYSFMTRLIRTKIRNKLKQAQGERQCPVLIAVTTLNPYVSSICMDRDAVEFALGSQPHLSWNWNPSTGEADGDVRTVTDLKDSVFLSPTLLYDQSGCPVPVAKYEPISGFILLGLGVAPAGVRAWGGLNPEARQPFDPSLLPDIPFCRFREWPSLGQIAFEWNDQTDRSDPTP